MLQLRPKLIGRGTRTAMPGPLKHTRRERFAQELAKGATLEEAHKLAGFAPNKSNAHRMKERPDVAERIAELQERAAERVFVTVADIAKQLDEDREFARTLKQSAAAVSATMGKAKVLGLLEDKSKVDITTAGKPLGLGAFYGRKPAQGD